jgi:hypothetical protein
VFPRGASAPLELAAIAVIASGTRVCRSATRSDYNCGIFILLPSLLVCQTLGVVACVLCAVVWCIYRTIFVLLLASTALSIMY